MTSISFQAPDLYRQVEIPNILNPSPKPLPEMIVHVLIRMMR